MFQTKLLTRHKSNETARAIKCYINLLASNDIYIYIRCTAQLTSRRYILNIYSRTAQLTSRRCILNIYSTNILTEYFKLAAHSPFFFSLRCRLFHNVTFFGSCNIHI
jgi:hypothetical protein